jgi:hypothetical protein
LPAISTPRTLEEVAAALHRGFFSLLAPGFEPAPGGISEFSRWVEQGRFPPDPAALNEAASCSGFLGQTVWAAVHEARPTHLAIIEALLAAGADVREADIHPVMPQWIACWNDLERRPAVMPDA